MEQQELRQWEEKCVQEHAPACAATCPLHVEVREILVETGKGDFNAALKILKKRLPFPGIISRICEQPCRSACKRAEAGDPVAIAALERACADFGVEPPVQRVPPRRNQRLAIVGGGLSGLTAAYDLAKKGYPVTLFEAGNMLGGQLWTASPEVLPSHLALAELEQVAQLGVDIRLKTALGRNLGLAQLRADFKAVYLALGDNPADTFGLATDAQGRVAVDPLTFATSEKGVFAGGSMLGQTETYSAITDMSHGRRAALSMDRYCQNVSLSASRQNEGSYVTQLHTVTTGIAPQAVTPITAPGNGYSRAQAAAEAQRCIQCECMECVKTCAYLEQYGSYPKKYAREIYNNLSIVMGTRQSNKFINSCSLCGLCAEVCPTRFNMADLVQQARRKMVEQKRMPASAHEFALRDMQFSNGDKFALARHAPGATASDVLFFPGCQLSAANPEYVERIYAWLQNSLPEGTRAGLMLRCCGAPADWAGRTDLFEAAMADFKTAYEAMGRPRLALACSSCYRVFQTHLPGAELVSLWELFDQYGLPSAPPVSKRQPALSVHDPCTARHQPQMQDSVRRIVGRLGYRLEELPLSREKTECCGYGGLMWLANPPLATETARRRAGAGSADYVAYCAMCRDFLAAQGKPTRHLLDLIFAPDDPDRATRPGPGYSQRHENRARLKRKLLKEIWGEAMDKQQPAWEAISLSMAAPVAARLEERLILHEDIQQVIEHAERTGLKLLQPETGHFLAHFRPTGVTYWVEYQPAEAENTFIIHNAYSHRMDVAEGRKS